MPATQAFQARFTPLMRLLSIEFPGGSNADRAYSGPYADSALVEDVVKAAMTTSVDAVCAELEGLSAANTAEQAACACVVDHGPANKFWEARRDIL